MKLLMEENEKKTGTSIAIVHENATDPIRILSKLLLNDGIDDCLLGSRCILDITWNANVCYVFS